MIRLVSRAIASRRRVICALGGLGITLAATSALANPLALPTPDQWVAHKAVGILDRVTLRAHWYESLTALRKAAAERDIHSRSLRGFSILSRNTETGEYVCDVFMVSMGSALVDNDRTVTFGHEVLHCFGFRHN